MKELIAEGKVKQARNEIWVAENPSFEHKPAQSFGEFIDDYLGVGKDVYKVIRQEGDKIWQGVSNGTYREGVMLAGVGSGKSFLSEVLSCLFTHYLLCLENPHQYFGLADDKPLAVVNMGTTATQAKNVIFSGIKRLIGGSEFFKQYNPEILQTEIRFADKNISLYCGNSKETMPLGLNIIFLILDEAAWYLDNENRSTAEEIYSVGKNRIISRFGDKGFVMVISAPRHEDDFITRLYNKCRQKKNAYASNFKTWEVKDKDKMKAETFDFEATKGETWKIPLDYKEAFDTNPEKAMRDFGARPSKVLEGYFRDMNALDTMFSDRPAPINEDNTFKLVFKAQDKEPRFIHIDLGLNRDGGDACGLAMGKFNGYTKIGNEEKPRIYIDLVLQIKALPKEEISFESVREMIYELKRRGFNIELVTLDTFQSFDTVQILKAKGIKADNLSVDKTTEPYDALKSAIYDKRIDIYKHDVLLKELKGLELVKGKKVDHQERGSKDVSDALAGVVYHITKKHSIDKKYGSGFGTIFA